MHYLLVVHIRLTHAPLAMLRRMARGKNSETISGGIQERLKADIFSATWAPGTRLGIGDLSQRYGTSSTVIREALTRLAGEKLLQFHPNRGFFVATYTTDELHDLSELRCRIEEYGIELAINRGDVKWESELIATHHLLERTPRRDPEDPRHITFDWFQAHQAFHAKLLEACGVPLLSGFAETLGDATALYRLWAAPRPAAGVRDIEAEHQAILDAVLAHDTELAKRLLREHYTRTLAVITEEPIEAD